MTRAANEFPTILTTVRAISRIRSIPTVYSQLFFGTVIEGNTFKICKRDLLILLIQFPFLEVMTYVFYRNLYIKIYYFY